MSAITCAPRLHLLLVGLLLGMSLVQARDGDANVQGLASLRGSYDNFIEERNLVRAVNTDHVDYVTRISYNGSGCTDAHIANFTITASAFSDDVAGSTCTDSDEVVRCGEEYTYVVDGGGIGVPGLIGGGGPITIGFPIVLTATYTETVLCGVHTKPDFSAEVTFGGSTCDAAGWIDANSSIVATPADPTSSYCDGLIQACVNNLYGFCDVDSAVTSAGLSTLSPTRAPTSAPRPTTDFVTFTSYSGGCSNDDITSITIMAASRSPYVQAAVCSPDTHEVTCGDARGSSALKAEHGSPQAIFIPARTYTVRCGVFPKVGFSAVVDFGSATTCEPASWVDADSVITATPCVDASSCGGIRAGCDTSDGTYQAQSMERAVDEAGLPRETASSAPSGASTTAPSSAPTPPASAAPSASASASPTLSPTVLASPSPTTPTSLAPTASPASDTGSDSSDDCFSALSTVQIEGQAEPRAMKDVRVGDRILVAQETNGELGYAAVVFLPHAANDVAASFVDIRHRGSDTSLSVTPAHLLAAADCASGAAAGLARADAFEAGKTCLLTEAGAAEITAIEPVTRRGVYTAVTEESGALLVVDGVLASPFAYSHGLVDAYYNLHRLAHRLAPSMLIAAADAVRLTQSALIAPLAVMAAKAVLQGESGSA